MNPRSKPDPLRVLVAMNAFKGTLTNVQACEAVSRALTELGVTHRALPIGDGGAGTLECVENSLGGERVSFPCSGAFGEQVQAFVLCHPNATGPQWIFIESSQVCGYPSSPTTRDALRATSRGLGQLLNKAHEHFLPALPHYYVGLGDSAISDAGIGMLSEIGFQFLDAGGSPLWGSAENLQQIKTISRPKQFLFEKSAFTILCDVMNPLCGPDGSARTFSPQKGATQGQIARIEEGMEIFAALVKKETGKQIRLQPMTGSAGGLSAAFVAFFSAQLVQGARFLFDWIDFDHILGSYDCLITGEGRTDKQTLAGKAPKECHDRALSLGKKLTVISGSLGPGYEMLLDHPNIVGCFASGSEPTASSALEACAKKIFRNHSVPSP